ncbi:hypothetical protein RJ639_019506 [Escallonia herrerae]|uniref:Retrovirus-related Pol polyprotein from transposon RE1 n=2 Tax=Escallonia herrerae TaxID=1293975 RepID=A0AA88VCK9_9ASTE|nr:hypothetical protein RJ639_019506 [Escallonia herrerae]
MVKTAMTGAWRSLDSSETTSSTLGGTLRPTMAHGGDHLSQLSFQLTSHKLTGKNYLEWAQSVKLAIDGRGKLGHLTGDVRQPAAGDPSLSVWRSENSLIIAWLINSMEPTIGSVSDSWKKPLPSLREAFSEIRREETRRKVMLTNLNPKPAVDVENSALLVKGNEYDNDKKKRSWCDHCKKSWHTRETCWKIHGKPPNWKKKNGSDNRTFQVSNEGNQGQQSTQEASPFTKEQLEHLYTLFQSPHFQVNPSCSLAQKGNFVSDLLSIIPSQNNSWIIDSGATDHMTSCSHLFSTYTPCARNKKIKIADGSLSAIARTGSIVLSPSITLHNVLHVPKLSCNLLSISKLTNDLKCQANFYFIRCEFQEMVSGRMIGNVRASGGLYFFEDGTNSRKHVQSTCLKSVSDSNDVMLWHYRLGHPNPKSIGLSHDIDGNKNEGSTGTKELLVYSRRKQIQRNETDASRDCQDSIPQTIQNSIEATGDTHTNPIHLNLPSSELSQSKSSMSNLDKPIAHCKVSQRKYVLDLLKETGMSGCRPVETPIDPNQKLGDNEGDLINTSRYQKLVGKLIYLSYTTPDIAFAVSLVSQFMHSPHEEHREAVYRIMRYFKSSPGKGLFFRKNEQRNFEAYTNADWAESITYRKSTSGY